MSAASGDWAPTDAVYEYDPASDSWRMLAPMPTPRGALAAAVIGGKIHAVGGVGSPTGAATRPPTKSTTPPTNKWSARAPLPTPRDHLAVAAEGGQLYAVGGRIDGNYGRNLATNEVMIRRPTVGGARTAPDGAQRHRGRGARRTHRRGRRRGADRHLQPGRGLRSKK